MANNDRDTAKEAFWRRVVDGHVDSGLTVRAYCGQQRVTEASFYAWRRTLAERDASGNSRSGRKSTTQRKPQPTFVPAIVTDTLPRQPIIIELAAGRRLQLPSDIAPARLAEVVHALEANAHAEAAQ